MARRGRGRRSAQPKRVAYQLIDPKTDTGKPMYQLLEDLIVAHHEEVRDARIALAFCTSWKADADGRVVLGKCKKASDLDRELAAYDFIILLNREFWQATAVGSDERKALLDHELCHAAVTMDKDGEPKVDERGRVVYRTRRHDIEEFACIVDRYGCYKHDLERFAAALARNTGETVWKGYQRVHAHLAAVGVDVPMETVLTWTLAERKAADEWARVEAEVRQSGAAIHPKPPAFLAVLMQGALDLDVDDQKLPAVGQPAAY